MKKYISEHEALITIAESTLMDIQIRINQLKQLIEKEAKEVPVLRTITFNHVIDLQNILISLNKLK